MVNIGISNPVTRQSTGRHYHQELAREIAHFIFPYLKASGGMLTLTDTYCLYNRARGTALISPDDLLQAATISSEMGLPVRLRKLRNSGVLALESVEVDENYVNETLAKIARERMFFTVIEIASMWSLSFQIASEKVAIAEGNGFLCRLVYTLRCTNMNHVHFD